MRDRAGFDSLAEKVFGSSALRTRGMGRRNGRRVEGKVRRDEQGGWWRQTPLGSWQQGQVGVEALSNLQSPEC